MRIKAWSYHKSRECCSKNINIGNIGPLWKICMRERWLWRCKVYITGLEYTRQTWELMTRRGGGLLRWSFLRRTLRNRERKWVVTDADAAFTLATDGRSSGARRACVDDRASAGRVFKLRCCLRVARCICKNINDWSACLTWIKEFKVAIKIHEFTLEGGCTWKNNKITLITVNYMYWQRDDWCSPNTWALRVDDDRWNVLFRQIHPLTVARQIQLVQTCRSLCHHKVFSSSFACKYNKSTHSERCQKQPYIQFLPFLREGPLKKAKSI